MKAYVVDTNVAIVANGDSENVPAQCQLRCVERLTQIVDRGLVVIDSLGDILVEYRRHLSQSGQPGVGDAFFRHVFLNQANPRKCESVEIRRHPENPEDFLEFPNDNELTNFDFADRKFVAVTLASQRRPRIQNAVDSDWWHACTALQRHGVHIDFICPDQMA